MRARHEATSTVLHVCRRHRRLELFFSSATVPERIRGKASGRAVREDAEESSVAPALLRCWQASIRLYQGRETGTAVAGQISNRAADFWRFVAPTARH